MKKLVLSMAALSAAALPCHALAWGEVGHRLVAAVAWQYLTPAAQAKIKALLDQDTDTLTPSDFADRANWADKYRDSDRDSKGPAYTGTSNWHFVDIPAVKADSVADAEAAEASVCPHPTLADGQAASVGAPADSCVIDKIKQFEVELANPATPVKEQILALKFLEHFVGDVHQPFHAIDDQDKGANCVSIAEGPRNSESLHSYWDTGALLQLLKKPQSSDYNAPSPVNPAEIEAIAKTWATDVTPEQKTAWSVDDPALWAAESAVLAHNVGYNLHMSKLPTCATDNRNEPIVPPAHYEQNAQAVVKEQIEKAGVRLAYVLNKIEG